MAKIDLSGNSGWQSKTGDKIQSLRNGAYDYKEISLNPTEVDHAWIESGLIIQVLSGQVQLVFPEEMMEYEKDQIIYLNDENILNLEIKITDEVTLGIFKEKA